MRKELLLLLLFVFGIFISVSYAQTEDYKSYFIIGNNVNMRSDTLLTSEIRFKANYGEEFQCRKINKNWYAWYTGMEDGFINSKYLTDEDDFVQKSENIENKNGTTLFSLLKHYRKSGHFEMAESLSFEIFNNYKNVEFPVHGDEWCPLYNELAFYEIVKGEKNEIDYTDKNIAKYCLKVIQDCHDSLIIGFAFHTLAKHYLLARNYKETEAILIRCISDYADFLFVPTSCDYDSDRRFSLIIEIKNLAFVLNYFYGKDSNSIFIENLSEILSNKNSSEKSKALAKDIQIKLFGGCWNN